VALLEVLAAIERVMQNDVADAAVVARNRDRLRPTRALVSVGEVLNQIVDRVDVVVAYAHGRR
jgi:hypothetical protein